MDCIDFEKLGALPIMPFPLVAANDNVRLFVRPARRFGRVTRIRPLTALD